MSNAREKLASYFSTYDGRQIDLARAAGLGADTMSHIIKGRRRPTLDQAAALEAATDGAVKCIDWCDP